MRISPSNEDFLRLDPYMVEQTIQLAVRGFLSSRGFPQTCAGRPPQRSTTDGGIEITIELPKDATQINPFVAHAVLIQVKSTDGHLTEAEIRKELDKEDVNIFFNSGGHFILAYPKYQPTNGKHGTWGKKHIALVEKLVKEILGDSVKADIWYPDDVRDFVAKYPNSWEYFPTGSHLLSAKCSTLDHIERNASGYFAQKGFDIPFVRNGPREEQLNELSELVIRGDYNCIEIRGNMGIGKTRLVYEVLKKLQVEPVVVWCNTPKEFNPETIKIVLALSDSSHMFAVVDECDGESVAQISDLAARNQTKLKTILILPYRERGPAEGAAPNILCLPQMVGDDLKNLLKEFALESEVESSIASICEGYPKLAWVLAREMKISTGNYDKYEMMKNLIKTHVFKDESTGRGWVDVILDNDDQKFWEQFLCLLSLG